MHSYRDYLERLIPIGDLFVLHLPGGEDGNGKEAASTEGSVNGWSEECVRKMRQPISSYDYYYPRNAETRRQLLELAWYLDPVSFEEPGEWDDAAIAKMREQTYQGWRLYISKTGLNRLAELS